MVRVVFLLAAALLAIGCKSYDEGRYLEAGADAVMPFKRGMKSALMAGLSEGPSSAIAACRVEAPKLAAESSTGGVKVGRTSTKLRNPSNAPKPWLVAVLDRYAQGAAEREPAVIVIDANTVGYVEPIYLEPLCVSCHGEVIDPELRATLDQLYPNDEAIGYAAGDWRGVFWAELPR